MLGKLSVVSGDGAWSGGDPTYIKVSAGCGTDAFDVANKIVADLKKFGRETGPCRSRSGKNLPS
jgi:hypothetical protein